jgi:hypothetical protein
MALSDDEFKSKMDYYDKLIERATAFNDKVTADDQSRARSQEKQAKKDIDAWKEKLEAGGANIEQYKELIRLAEDLIATNRSQREVFGRIKTEIKVTVNKFNDFVRSTAVQYNYAQQMAKQYKLINRELGANAHQSDLIQKNFKLASPEVILMGGSLEDMTEMMQSFGEETGRARALTKGELEDITAIAKGVNLTTSEATKMAESFDLMGMSTDSMASHLANVYKESQTLGLNAQKVVKVLNDNIKTMQSYSFANGVKGMTEMAKQAVKMRLDVSDVLLMSEKFYQPEAAIEAAANLQMLGGDIAKAFGDPFETMYLARNKPEELAKKVGEMTENMMQFNEETGEYEMPAEVRMQLKATGEQLGINTDKMIEMARQTSKIKDIQMKFTSIGDKETRESLSGLAKFSKEKGMFVIQHKGDELGLDEISDGMAEEILKANKTEGKSDSELFKQIALNTQTMSERFDNLYESQAARVAGQTNIYEITAGNLENTVLKDIGESFNTLAEAFIKKANFEDIFDAEDMSLEGLYGDGILEMKETIKAIDDGLTQFENNLVKINKSILKNREAGEDEEDREAKDMVSMPGSGGRVLTGEFGSFSLDDRDLIVAGDPKKLAGGNSSTTPTKMEFGNINISGRIEIVSPDGSTNGMDMSSLKPQFEKMIISHMNGSFRNGGVSSSKETTDYMG